MRTPKHLRSYQLRGAQKIYRAKRRQGVALLADMGMGKTIIVLTAIAALIRHGKRKAAMVVVPLRVLENETWQDEAKLWTHTKHLRFAVVHGNEPERMDALHQSADIYLTNYENLKWMAHLAGRRKAKKLSLINLPDILALDESSFIKDAGSVRFKALKMRLLRFFQTVVSMTGTPMPNSLLEMWSQIYVVDLGDRLGTSHSRFKARFFEQVDYQGYKWEPRDGAVDYVLNLIKDVVVRLDAKDWVRMPKIVPNTIWITLPPRVMQLYRKHEREMFIELFESGKSVTAVNAAVLSMQCWQIAQGAIYDDPEVRDSWTVLHDKKLDALDEIVDEHWGQSMMTAYWFKHDLARLHKRFPKAAIITKKNVLEIKKQWNARKLPHLLIQAGSNAYGLNMQHGGHIVTFFSIMWSLEKYFQLIHRLRRPDQVAESILANHILAHDTVDEPMFDTLQRKDRGQQYALNRLRAYALERGYI